MPNWHYDDEYGHSRPQRWCLMCIMCSLTVKNNEDIETLVRSNTQKTDDTKQHSTTDTGWTCPAHLG